MASGGDSAPTFAELLRRARRAAGLTQEELADRAALSVRGICDLERGARRAPRAETVDALAQALRLSEADQLAWHHARRRPMEPSGVSAVSATRMPVLVGRHREVELLRQAIDQGLAGRGRTVLLAGEPGVGKTSLAEDLAAYALNRGVRVLWGRCHEGEGAPAFWPWTQIIRAYLEGVAHDALRRDLGDAASAIAQDRKSVV